MSAASFLHSQQPITKYWYWLLIAVGAYFCFFLHLASFPVVMWDESRLAMNAVEMLNNGKMLVTYYKGAPDLWNTKPPLVIWLLALSMKVVGINELGLRIPVAIFATITAIALFELVYKKTGDVLAAVFSAFILMTFEGYNTIHAARTADYDAFLTLFTLLFVVHGYFYIENPVKNNRSMLWMGVFFALAFLTKCAAALISVPCLVLYAVYKRNIVQIFTKKHFYIGLFIAISPVICFYTLRELQAPGYLTATLNNDFLGRFNTTLGGPNEPFYYYLKGFIEKKASPWLLYCTFTLLVVLLPPYNDERKRFALFSWGYCILFWLIISKSQTKLEWYQTPMFPFFSIALACGLSLIWSAITNQDLNGKKAKWPVILYFVALFSFPMYSIINSRIGAWANGGWDQESYGWYMKNLKAKGINLKQVTFVNSSYSAHMQFYQHKYLSKGVFISIYDKESGFENIKDTCISCSLIILGKLSEKYDIHLIDDEKTCKLFTVEGLKKAAE